MNDVVFKNKNLNILSENEVYISEQQRKQLDAFYEIQKKLGLKKEKGARYTLKHPFDRTIQSDFEKIAIHKPHLYLNRS